jgi:hypothetical protein
VIEIIFVYTGSDADILAAEVGGEGVLGQILPTCLEIEAQLPDDLYPEIPLLLTGIALVQEVIIYLGGFPDMFQQVFKGGPGLCENFIQEPYGATFLVLVQQGIVGVLFISGQVRLLFF